MPGATAANDFPRFGGGQPSEEVERRVEVVVWLSDGFNVEALAPVPA